MPKLIVLRIAASEDLPNMYLCSKFEDSILLGYLETELNAQCATYQPRIEV